MAVCLNGGVGLSFLNTDSIAMSAVVKDYQIMFSGILRSEIVYTF